jgi:histidine triad (HIT) family protein
MECVFCTKKEIKERRIIENDLAYVFPTNIPIVPGHLLICPKRCVANLDDMSDDEILAIFDLRNKLKPALQTLFGASGFNYAINENETGGQSVPHVHLHMLPRKEGDSGITKYEPREFLYRPGSRDISKMDELKDISKLIKDAL